MNLAPTMLLAFAATATGQAPTAPTFHKDVAPILHAQCAGCHRPGEAAPFALIDFQDAKKRGKLIARVTQSRLMPPWKAGKGAVAFRGERRLSDEQIAVLKRWVDAGMPEGDAAGAAKAPAFSDEWPLGKPDLVVKMPRAYKVRAEGRDIYRNFAVSLGLKEDKWVRAIDFRPSARSVVHHTLFFLDPTGKAAKREQDSGQVGFSGAMGGLGRGGGGGGGRLGLGGLGGTGGPDAASITLGGWAVGATARALPDGLAYKVTKGSDLILATHFHPSGKAEEEASTVALYFADKAPTKRFTGVQLPPAFGALAGINIPAGKKDFTIQDSYVLPADVRAFGVSAHAHYLAKTFTVIATPPGGKAMTLLTIPDWDFAWQEQYQFADYVDLPKGTKVDVRIVYDNSKDNPNNPSETPRRVRWGPQSTDEMGSITLMVIATREAEFSQLQDGYRRHLRDSFTRSPWLKMLKKRQ